MYRPDPTRDVMKEKLTVGIFTNAYKPIVSGVVNSIALFKKGLESLGHQVHIFAPRFSGYKDTEPNIHRFRSVNLSTKVKFPLAIPYSRRIFPLIPKLKLDIIHTQHPYILGQVGARFAKKIKIPLVYTFHTQFEQYAHYIPLNQELVKRLARVSVIKYAQKCDCIITPAESMRDLLLEYGVTTRLAVLPNCIETEKFEGVSGLDIRKKYHLSPTDRVLIYVGRMGIEKNLGFMLRAFKTVSLKNHNNYLMILGEGPELKALKDLSLNLGLSTKGGSPHTAGRSASGRKDKVIFTGKVDYTKVPSYLASANLFIMSSVTEVKPLALLEAMAAGLPVVAVSAPGAKDTITTGKDGFLTRHDVTDFADHIIKLLENPELINKMSQSAKQTAQKYSISEVTQELVNIYRSLIKK